MHWRLPGVRWILPITQKGVWGHDWQNSFGNWFSGGAYWYEVGESLVVDSVLPIRITWQPDLRQPPEVHIVSPVMTPHPAQLCSDY